MPSLFVATQTRKAAADTLAAQAPLSETNARTLGNTLRHFPGIIQAMLADLDMAGLNTANAVLLSRS